MPWMKRIAFTLVAIIVLLLGIGLVLPATFNVQRPVDIASAADKVFKALSART